MNLKKKRRALKFLLEIINDSDKLRNIADITPYEKKLLIDIVRKNTLWGFFYMSLNEKTFPLFTSSEKEYLHDGRDTTLIYNLINSMNLKKLLKILSENNINIVLIKGNSLLTKKIYEKQERFMGDIDFIIKKKDIIKLHYALKNEGFISLNIHDEFKKREAKNLTGSSFKKYKEVYKKGEFNSNKEEYKRKESLLGFNNFEEANKEIFQRYFSSELNKHKKIKFSEKKVNYYFKDIERAKNKILRQLEKNDKYLNNKLELYKRKVYQELDNQRKHLENELKKEGKELEKKVTQHKRKEEKYKNTIYKSINELISLKNILKSEYHLTYSDPKEGKLTVDGCPLVIEPHFGLFEHYYPFKPDINDIFDNSIKTKYNKINTCSPELDILVLGLHLFHNELMAPLKHLIDLKKIISSSNLDWEKVVKLTKKWNASSFIFFYLNSGKKLLKLDIPSNVLSRLNDDIPRTHAFFLKKMDIKELILGRKNLYSKMLNKMYLENGITMFFTSKLHSLFHK